MMIQPTTYSLNLLIQYLVPTCRAQTPAVRLNHWTSSRPARSIICASSSCGGCMRTIPRGSGNCRCPSKFLPSRQHVERVGIVQRRKRLPKCGKTPAPAVSLRAQHAGHLGERDVLVRHVAQAEGHRHAIEMTTREGVSRTSTLRRGRSSPASSRRSRPSASIEPVMSVSQTSPKRRRAWRRALARSPVPPAMSEHLHAGPDVCMPTVERSRRDAGPPTSRRSSGRSGSRPSEHASNRARPFTSSSTCSNPKCVGLLRERLKPAGGCGGCSRVRPAQTHHRPRGWRRPLEAFRYSAHIRSWFWPSSYRLFPGVDALRDRPRRRAGSA